MANLSDKEKRATHRRWVFTLYTGIDGVDSKENKEYAEDVAKAVAKDCNSYVIGIEECPNTKRVHLQCCMTFKAPKRFGSVKAWFEKHEYGARKPHFEVCRDWEASVKYCKKDGRWTAAGLGKGEGQGKRNDLKKIRDDMLDGKPFNKIIRNVSSLQALKFAEGFRKYDGQQRHWKPTVFWLWGPAGTGKTRFAYENFPGAYWTSGGKWWDGYTGHSVAIIDDFRGEQIKFEDMLRILDRYPHRVEVKGSSQPLLAHTIIITSPFKPIGCYAANEKMDQLIRRIDHVMEFKTEEAADQNSDDEWEQPTMPKDYKRGRCMNNGTFVPDPEDAEDEEDEEVKEEAPQAMADEPAGEDIEEESERSGDDEEYQNPFTSNGELRDDPIEDMSE